MEICMQNEDPILNRTKKLLSALLFRFSICAFISNANSFVSIHNTFSSARLVLASRQSICPKRARELTRKLKRKKINDKTREIIYKSLLGSPVYPSRSHQPKSEL